MRRVRAEAFPLAVLIVCAAICAGVTLSRSRTPGMDVVWYGPAPHPYLSEVMKGVDAEAAGSGGSVFKKIGQEWSQSNENTNVEALAGQGHKGFSIYPADPAGANGLFAQLVRLGQTVVCYGAEPQLPTPASFTVATDVQAAAEQAAEELIRRMGGRGKIVNILENVTDVNTQKRQAGVEAAVKRHPGVAIIRTINNVPEVSAATSKIQSALAADAGQIDGMIATGFNPTVAAAAVLSQWNSEPSHKRIVFIGIDTDDRVLSAIRDGGIDATVAQNTFAHGYVPCAILRLTAQGWGPKQPYRFIDSGVVIVDKSNVDTYSPALRKMTDSILAALKTEYLTPPQGN